ncbi:hypothetical protein [Saccharothrix sp. NRRL B-16314]|uniref:hypothetical protein n=1 Tax=Saccharothrix sp. NRRL B-16314 TaxID=1463825 RepID=UPI0005277F63|nr:hypothetical protein [Saccharothrix sp. NRRL B-16314]
MDYERVAAETFGRALDATGTKRVELVAEATVAALLAHTEALAKHSMRMSDHYDALGAHTRRLGDR